ncbi:DUF2589 domain-containing protein [Pseudoalteromonas ruthenica]|uniref:DUF2589 domain-containing protein n=1 Tax=Pseudoalteromonas ruthenica TaxID=151081 RepID=UPI00110B54AC|nr:DUF2589 domain-containing protein [Pseudoalteromonas ruthenica]TMO49008.1 hypothetical protein CWC24_03020 [Pseudoalteromonas ruthenica]TMO51137.1 hypothetical protein CWC23_08315 [Pseudoalteromonas ruthenica]
MMFGKEKMNAQMLTDITRGIHHAVNTTGTMISQQYVMQLQQFFDTQEDGSLAAKMVKVQVDEQHDMYVPLIALVQPQGIALDKMRFDMSIQISESELKRATHQVDGFNAERVAFKVNLSPKTSDSNRRRTDIVDVEMQFTRCEAPEGMHRLIEQYANMIQPFKNGEPVSDEPNSPPGQEPLKSAAGSERKPNLVRMNTHATGNLDEGERDEPKI